MHKDHHPYGLYHYYPTECDECKYRTLVAASDLANEVPCQQCKIGKRIILKKDNNV